MIFRIRHRTQGRYTHCRIFAGDRVSHLHEVGRMTFRNDEFEAFRGEFRAVSSVEFVLEDFEAMRQARPIEESRNA